MSDNEPAQWLITEYEATDTGEFSHSQEFDLADRAYAVLGPGESVYVQPIFTLKSCTDTGHPMRIREVDYFDSGRWWL
jgi:hypothetical protein